MRISYIPKWIYYSLITPLRHVFLSCLPHNIKREISSASLRSCLMLLPLAESQSMLLRVTNADGHVHPVMQSSSQRLEQGLPVVRGEWLNKMSGKKILINCPVWVDYVCQWDWNSRPDHRLDIQKLYGSKTLQTKTLLWSEGMHVFH